MKIRRFPILSESAPMKIVVSVATTDDAATISDMSEGNAENILYMNTFKYIFSTTQAT